MSLNWKGIIALTSLVLVIVFLILSFVLKDPNQSGYCLIGAGIFVLVFIALLINLFLFS